MNIKDMCERRANLVAQARSLLDTAESEKRELTQEETVQYDKLLDEAQQLKAQVTRAERLEAEERDLEEPLSRAHRPTPSGEPGDEDAEARSREQHAAFRRYLQRGSAVLTNAEIRALQADSDVAGGYLVAPQDWSANLIQGLDNAVFMRQIADVQPALVKAESMGRPTLDTDASDPEWTSELSIGSEDTTLAFGKRELFPHPLAKFIKVSNKLLRAGNLDVEALVRSRLEYKFAVAQENAFINGTGDGQPLGVMVASDDGISTSRDVSEDNTETAVTADGLINCTFALKPGYRSRASWLFHTGAVKAISKLKNNEGQYLWHPGLGGGAPDRLLTRPIYESDYMPNTFTSGLYVGILGAFKQGYWIVDALQMSIQVLKELYAATNQTGYIGRLESDGMPVLEEAFVRVKLA